MLEAALAITALVIILAIARRGRRLREQEEAGPTFGELLNRQDILILDTETTGLGKAAEVVEIAIVDTDRCHPPQHRRHARGAHQQ